MKKTKLIVFRPRPIDLAHYISLVMDDNVVEQVESTKFLGFVVVDQVINWKTLVNFQTLFDATLDCSSKSYK